MRSQSHMSNMIHNFGNHSPTRTKTQNSARQGGKSLRRGYSCARHDRKRIRQKEKQAFVRNQKNRMKFENMVNGRFIFDELYHGRQENNYTEDKKEQDYQEEVLKVKNNRKIRFTKQAYEEMFGKSNGKNGKMKPFLSAKEKSGYYGRYKKHEEIFYYDKYGNKKKDDQKKGEMFDKIEKDVVDFDLMYLKEHQE